MKGMEPKIAEYVRTNSLKYNRNLTEEEISKITESYLEESDAYDEDRLDAYIETIKLKWADEKRSDQGAEDLKNWRLLRRASVVSGSTFMGVNDLKFVKKSKETYDFILNVLETNETVTFASMNPRQKKRLVDTMAPQRVPAGTYLIKEGENDNRMYIVEHGKFLVLKNGEIIKTMERGGFFGEIALLHNVARTANVKSVEDSLIWVVEQKAYVAIRQSDRTKYKNIAFKGLKKSKLFDDFQHEELKAIARVLVYKYCKVGTRVTVKEDEIFLFVRDGKIIDVDGVIREVKMYDFVTSSFECASVVEGAKVKRKQPRREGLQFHGF